MSTRSFIGIETEGFIEGIYCHFDGYPGGVGYILYNHYTRNETKKLIALGNISVLGSKINPTEYHTFKKPQKDVVIAYGRDRGEENQNSIIISKQKLMTYNPYWVDYVYILTEDHNWLVRHITQNKFNVLTFVNK